MANSRLSFVIAIRLLADNFNKGANRIKSQLLSMQRNFLALASAAGAGAIGLTNFVSKAIEVAKATTQASVALKNVSGSTSAFVENQKWLIEVARRYGVEINSLTTGFAKFKAAADVSSMSLEDQRKIFESVSRASVAFGLSAEDQRGIFMALSQMMSKNKVMAEELRLQFAERMPVAIQAMAKAAGVSVGELDNLMKQGKVLSADVLPKFADALTELIPNIDTNNLNKSLVDLSNTFNALVKSIDVEGKFKKMVEVASGLLTYLSNHTSAIATTIRVALAGMFAKGLTNTWGDAVADYERTVAAAVKAVEGGQRAINRVEKARTLLKAAETTVYELEEEKKVIATTATAEEIEDIDARLNNARANLKRRETELYKAEEAKKKAETKATAEQIKYAAQNGATGWTKAMNVIAHSAKMAGRALKAAFMANIWTAVIAGITAVIAKLWKFTSAASVAYREYRKLGDFTVTEEMKDLDQWSELLHHKDESVRIGALQRINEILGTQLTLEDDITAAIDKRQKLIAAQERLKQAQEVRKIYEARIGGRNKFLWDQDIVKQRYDKATIAEAEARAEISALTRQEKKTIPPTPTPTPTPVTEGKPVKVEVVNLDPNDFGDFDIEQKPLVDSREGNDKSEEVQAAVSRGAAILAKKRDKSRDWQLSDTEIQAADLAFKQEQVDELLDIWHETGGILGEALTNAITESADLSEALKATEIKDALTSLQKEMDETLINGFEGAVSDIDGIVNAFDRLTDAMDEDASAWEKVMAVWELFSSTTQSVIGIIESIAKAKEISAQMEKAAAAQSVAANTSEAASEVGKNVAKKTPGWAALVAVPAAIAAILAAFAMIPKFAKGGIVGGTSTHGDKVLARLNSGEGVLTPEGIESLHDAANPRNARAVKVTGVLVGRGRDLKAVIDTETKYKSRTR